MTLCRENQLSLSLLRLFCVQWGTWAGNTVNKSVGGSQEGKQPSPGPREDQERTKMHLVGEVKSEACPGHPGRHGWRWLHYGAEPRRWPGWTSAGKFTHNGVCLSHEWVELPTGTAHCQPSNISWKTGRKENGSSDWEDWDTSYGSMRSRKKSKEKR